MPPKREGGFPELRIVPVSQLLLHEDVDLERVARLLDRLSADGTLKNPPIVASLARSERYLLLDGANRVSAIQNLEIPHLLVQVESFDDPALMVAHWNHVVRDLETEALLERAGTLDGVDVSHGHPDEAPLDEEGFLASIVTASGKAVHLVSRGSIEERISSLRELVAVYYRRDARMDRVNHDNVAVLAEQHTHFGALVRFPDFKKDELRAAAEKEVRLPSGVTRILVPRRVLGFNLRLPLLKSSLPLADKRRWLEEEIQHKVAEHKVRYYQEPTFVFDD